METIYLNVPKISAEKEVIYKRKIILHDDKHILAYGFKNKYRLPGVQGDDDLLTLVKEITGLEIREEDMLELKRIISGYMRYNCYNNKLVPIVRELVKDYYTYYVDLNDSFMQEISKYGNEWYREPKRLNIYGVLTSDSDEYKKIRLPLQYIWKSKKG